MDLSRIEQILTHLGDEKDQFILDLAAAMQTALDSGDHVPLDDCIEDWEDVAELNSIPGFKARVWQKHEILRNRGIIPQGKKAKRPFLDDIS